jgi:16S rRNA processing protein RimM
MAGRRQSPEPEGHVRVGQIVGPFGIKGGLKVAPLTDFPERFDVGSLLYLAGLGHKVTESHWHKSQVRIMLEDVATVEDAEALKWQYLTVPASERPELDDDEYLARELVGLTVVEDGKALGTVDEVVPSPAHDLLRVGDVLIPCVGAFIKEVDLEKREITVTLIEGMRPGDAAEEVR